MGRKAKSAGTTKHRERTCDKPQCRNNDILYEGSRNRSARRKQKKTVSNNHQDQYNLFLHYVYEGNYQEAYNVYNKNIDYGNFKFQSCGADFKGLLEKLDSVKIMHK